MSDHSETIKNFNRGRLPWALKLKYQAMRENAFRFFRGTCHLFYARLSKLKSIPKSPVGWICGDLHLENFGSYRGGNKLVYFDLNDFDEAIKAPVLWELIRVVTSIFIAFQTLEIDADQSMNMALLFIRSYRNTLLSGKESNIDPRTSKGIVSDFLKKAEKSSSARLLKKRTLKKGRSVVLNTRSERHFKLDKDLKARLIVHMETWLRQNSESPYNYKVKDVVYRLAGTGSIGQKRYLFLLKNRLQKEDYLLVDMKQAFSSSLSPFVYLKQPEWANQAERIVTVQKRMQHISSALLSTSVFEDESYVMQELQPVKDTIRFKLIQERYRDIYQVISDMGMLTASSQLRSSGLDGTANKDELIKFAITNGWEQEVVEIASRQAEMACSDYALFEADYRAGKYDD
jgi:uncharacterized protein (DUF2252 family)